MPCLDTNYSRTTKTLFQVFVTLQCIVNLSSILDESETKRIDGAKFVKIFLLSKYTAQNIKIFVKISQKLSRWKFCAIFVDILMCMLWLWIGSCVCVQYNTVYSSCYHENCSPFFFKNTLASPREVTKSFTRFFHLFEDLYLVQSW